MTREAPPNGPDGPDGPDGRRAEWWRLVEDHLTALALEAEDEDDGTAPWSDAPAGSPALTAEQRAFLTGDDQPGVPRVSHPDHAPDDQPPVPRFGAGADGAPG
ncbi:MAG TPA: hypothetical protein VFC99_10860 [Acidimicrobiia bacterium]|nr:hypothetical protein [Acidimicrobiia bacterium]